MAFDPDQALPVINSYSFGKADKITAALGQLEPLRLGVRDMLINFGQSVDAKGVDLPASQLVSKSESQTLAGKPCWRSRL